MTTKQAAEMSKGPTKLAQRFARHEVGVGGHQEMETIRAYMFQVAKLIDTAVPSSAVRERSLALTKLQEALMWANAGISSQYEALPILEVPGVHNRAEESPTDRKP